MRRTALFLIAALGLLLSPALTQGNKWTSIKYFGWPCRNSTGEMIFPYVHAQYSNQVQVDFRTQHNARLIASFVVIGFSNQSWGPIKLPYALGMKPWLPGCQLLVSPDIVIPAIKVSSGFTLKIYWPLGARIPGRKFHLFVLIVEQPRPNQLAFSTSDGATIEIKKP